MRRLCLLSIVLIAMAVACGIPDNGRVNRIPEDDLGVLGETIPTTTTTTTPPTTLVPTTTTEPINTSTTIATEEVTLYFISGAQLTEYELPVRNGASLFEILIALQQGPPAPGLGLRSALPLPAQARLGVTEDGTGVITIELPAGFFELIPTSDQLLAVGQLVLTITGGRIGQVRFTQEGQGIAVPRGTGEFSEAGQPLPPRDYLELLQPPLNTTSTTTTTVTTVV